MSDRWLRLLTPEEARAEWVDLEPLIEAAIPFGNGELLAEDILNCVDNGSMFAFAFGSLDIEGVFVIEFIHYPRKRSMNIVVAAGAGASDVMSEMVDRFKEIAKTGGASCIEARSRLSVARLGRMKVGSTPGYFVSVLEV